ncbi:MAG: D-glycero-beta-D-manno-heptose 1-phosphate adenylyltransferase [Bacteroidia bacterium]
MSKHSLVRTKIFENTQSLQAQLELWRQNQKKIVFTNGCFDILHRGHVDYLAKAADLGDVLIIGVNTDSSVSKLKGAHRPIQDEESRMQILASLGFVDAVILFGEATPYELIKLVQPDVLVKGSDYQAQNIVGYDIVSAKGGEIKTLDFIPGYSTSAIEAKIKAN